MGEESDSNYKPKKSAYKSISYCIPPFYEIKDEDKNVNKNLDEEEPKINSKVESVNNNLDEEVNCFR